LIACEMAVPVTRVVTFFTKPDLRLNSLLIPF